MTFVSGTAKKVLSNTAFQLIGKFVSMSITILATILITRMYGREGFGEFSLMQNFPAIFFIIVDFGLNAVVAREIALDWDKAKSYFFNVLAMRTIVSVLMIIGLWVALFFFPYSQSLRFGMQIGLFLILTQSLYATTNIIFQVKLRYDLSSIGYIFGSLFILCCVLIFSYYKVSVTWINFSYVIGGILTFIVNMYLLKSLGLEFQFSLNKKICKHLLIQTLPLGLMFIFSQINFKIDAILMSVLPIPPGMHLTKTEAVAIYSLPYKIFEVCLVLPTFFMNAMYPVFIRSMAESREKLKDVLFKALSFLSVLGVGVGVVGVLFTPLMINLLGGSEFIESVVVLRLLLGGLIVFFLTQPLAWLIVTLGYQKFLPYVYLVSAVFNVTANYLFIPIYSFYASSVITILSEFLILLMLIYCARKSWKLYYYA